MALPKKLQDKWDEAEKSGEKIGVGTLVICDKCDGDFTDSPAVGGFIFGSYAYCPNCAPMALANIRSYNEEGYIKARCPEGKSFADFVREYRGPGAYIQVTRA